MASADVDITRRPYEQDPSAPNPTRPQPVGDDLDDLLSYDVYGQEAARDVDANNTAAANAKQRDRSGAEADLGIDEEIKIRKPRRPNVKLDEDRLLSEKGIPKLRKISKTKFKFRGKGHEFSDVQRLLNTYQLWLDDLFPKAKFADGLAIIEKVGHKKRLKMMRQEWINEEKPKPREEPESDVDGDVAMDTTELRREGAPSLHRYKPGTVALRDLGGRAGRTTSNGMDVGMSNDAGPGDNSDDEALYSRPDPVPAPETIADEAEEDELDQLLAEDERIEVSKGPSKPPEANDFDRFADDEEAMAGMW